MEAAPPRTRGRRTRRGTVERPLNARLVRVGFLVVVPALVALLFSLSPTGALPRQPLDPLFDADSAASFAETLSVQFPSRVPGSTGAGEAAVWYRETVAALGLPTEEDIWTEELAGLGDVELRNVVTVVRGQSEEAIVIVAHRDNAGPERAVGENASGTAALIELGRGFAPQEEGPDPLPQHTLVLLSTDGGAFGGAGAARFAETSPLARDAIAVIVLDDLGRGQPRIAIAGDRPVTPARPLLRTAAARVAEETRIAPAIPSLAAQLLALGLPYALEEQGRFLAEGQAALTIGAARDSERTASIAAERLGQFGRATEALIDSLDVVGSPFPTPDSIFFADRAASGWTLRLALVLAVVPFALGVVDLVVRGRRRGLPFAPALRALRARLGYWAGAGLLVWLGSLVGVFPTGASLPLPPYASLVTQPPLLGLFAIVGALLLGWLALRRRLGALPAATDPEERLAGLVVALLLVGAVAVVLAVVQPYALLFVLPSLYAWLWMPLEGRAGARIALFAIGLTGPVAGLALLSHELGLSALDAALYVVGLVTVGYLALVSAVLFLGWAAAAAQVGALAFGRYGPYAGGASPPPPGPLRRLVRR